MAEATTTWTVHPRMGITMAKATTTWTVQPRMGITMAEATTTWTVHPRMRIILINIIHVIKVIIATLYNNCADHYMNHFQQHDNLAKSLVSFSRNGLVTISFHNYYTFVLRIQELCKIVTPFSKFCYNRLARTNEFISRYVASSFSHFEIFNWNHRTRSNCLGTRSWQLYLMNVRTTWETKIALNIWSESILQFYYLLQDEETKWFEPKTNRVIIASVEII